MNKPRPLCASSGGSMARATCAGMGSRRPSSVISNRSRTGGSPSVRTVTRTAPPGSPDAVCLIALVKSSLTTSSTESRMLGYARSRERTRSAPGRSSRPFPERSASPGLGLGRHRSWASPFLGVARIMGCGYPVISSRRSETAFPSYFLSFVYCGLTHAPKEQHRPAGWQRIRRAGACVGQGCPRCGS